MERGDWSLGPDSYYTSYVTSGKSLNLSDSFSPYLIVVTSHIYFLNVYITMYFYINYLNFILSNPCELEIIPFCR